jgi:hypothetical protein
MVTLAHASLVFAEVSPWTETLSHVLQDYLSSGRPSVSKKVHRIELHC